MARKNFYRAKRSSRSRLQSDGRTKDVALIRGDFSDYLRARNYTALTIGLYQRHLIRIACWLREHPHHPPLRQLSLRMVPRLLVQALPRLAEKTRWNYRAAVIHWLRFTGHYSESVARPWAPWIRDYLQFLRTHRGVGQSTLDLSESNAKVFMEWQFGTAQANWSQVQPADIWSFARQRVRGVKPIMGKSRLGYLRRFLRFVHLRGACGPQLAAAIPKVALCGGSPRPEVLTPKQQRKLRAFFRRSTREGKRNYAMTLCMLDLGLRRGEVIGLRLQDIDWRARRLNIRVTKTGRGRQLPLSGPVLEALRDYIKNGRPKNTLFDHVFLRHPRRSGYPLSRSSISAMIQRAYRHCGFPATWWGTHRLRHTFASRLHQRGVDMKPIADLMGHRRLDSTNHYTQVDLEALRQVAQRWPWPV